MAAPQSAKDLLALELAVAYYPGPDQYAEFWRELFRRRKDAGTLKWDIRVFETAAHMAKLVDEASWDILFTHWHGESGTSIDLPNEIAKRYRACRDTSPGRNLTFLVAGFTGGHGRPQNQKDAEPLLKIYDMLIEKSMSSFDDFQDIAVGWWNMRHATSPEQTLAFTRKFGVFVSKQT